jgi:hypothetical protein
MSAGWLQVPPDRDCRSAPGRGGCRSPSSHGDRTDESPSP